MKAFVKKKYGGPEVLSLEEVEFPKIKEGHLIVKIFANSANPADWHILRGKPFIARLNFGLFKPKQMTLGVDFAGIVEQVGKNVSQFKVGDKVFGESISVSAFAEYVCVSENDCVQIPNGKEFSEMACLPIAGLTALQAIVTHGQIKTGETVLINGASGGVGHFAVQIAKACGANVTAVCSLRNVDFVRSLGADNVIAYDKENIHKHNSKYNLIVDTHGNLKFQDYKRMGDRGVMTGFTTMSHMILVLLRKAFSELPLTQFTAKTNKRDLNTLASLMKDNKIKVHIDKIFTYKQIPDAIRYVETMRTRGKVVMIWNNAE